MGDYISILGAACFCHHDKGFIVTSDWIAILVSQLSVFADFLNFKQGLVNSFKTLHLSRLFKNQLACSVFLCE